VLIFDSKTAEIDNISAMNGNQMELCTG